MKNDNTTNVPMRSLNVVVPVALVRSARVAAANKTVTLKAFVRAAIERAIPKDVQAFTARDNQKKAG